MSLEAFLVATGLVALAEIGDKTQLLALVLAARFRKPWPIVAGILVATLANHAFAGALGHLVTAYVSRDVLRWVLGVSFLAMAAWTLVPDQLDDEEPRTASGVFVTTLIAFFLAEMGDKTQIATVALAAQFATAGWASWVAVVSGTTLGMMIANVPVVFVGERMAKRIPLKPVRMVAAALFAVIGVLVLLQSG